MKKLIVSFFIGTSLVSVTAARAGEIEDRIKKLEEAIGGAKGWTPPSGMVIFTQEARCPVHFVELTAMRGRYLVGLPERGTSSAVVGKQLTDKERRNTVAWHEHTVNTAELAHTHPVAADALAYIPGAAGAAEGGPLKINVTHQTAGAEFAQKEIKTHANGVMQEKDEFINAPYIQLLACVSG